MLAIHPIRSSVYPFATVSLLGQTRAPYAAPSSPSVVPIALRKPARRAITPQAGHALEILGHAIEYLTDEFVEHHGSMTPPDVRIQSVQLLMALNRQVYYECPQVPEFKDRCRAFLHTILRRPANEQSSIA